MDLDLLRTLGTLAAAGGAATAAASLLAPRGRPVPPPEEIWAPAPLAPRCVRAALSGGGAPLSPPGEVEVRAGADCAVLCAAFEGCASWTLEDRRGTPVCTLLPPTASGSVEDASEGSEVGGRLCAESGRATEPFPAGQIRRAPEPRRPPPARSAVSFCPEAPAFCREGLPQRRLATLCSSQAGRRIVRRCCGSCP